MTKKQENTGQIIINKLSFWGFIENYFKNRRQNKYKYKPTDEDRNESAKVKALMKQINTLESINDSYVIEIENLIKNGSNNKETIEEKVLNFASKLFLSEKNAQTTLNSGGRTTPTTYLESGKNYTDQELNKIVKIIPPKYKKLIKTMPYNVVAERIKQEFPDMSETSIKRGIELIKEV